MVVFPESLNRVDADDTKKAIQILENYINYMCERVDHAVNNMTNNLASQGDLTPYVVQTIDEVKTIVSQMASAVSEMKGTVNGLSTKTDELEKSVKTINTTLESLDEDMTIVKDNIISLDARVKALEGEIPEEGGTE